MERMIDDDELAAMRAKLEAGETLNKEEALSLLDEIKELARWTDKLEAELDKYDSSWFIPEGEWA